MVSDRYHDSMTVRPSARREQAENGHAHGEQAVVDLARLAGQQDDADGVLVALDRLGDGDQQAVVLRCGGCRAAISLAVAGAGEPQSPP